MPTNKKTGKKYKITGKKFKKGSPQLTFTKRNGTKFTMTYRSSESTKRAKKGWISKGGKSPKIGNLGY